MKKILTVLGSFAFLFVAYFMGLNTLIAKATVTLPGIAL